MLYPRLLTNRARPPWRGAVKQTQLAGKLALIAGSLAPNWAWAQAAEAAPTAETAAPAVTEAPTPTSAASSVPGEETAPAETATPLALEPAQEPAAAAPIVAAPIAAEPPPAPEPAKLPFEITGAPGKGITFKTGDNFSLNVKSRIQLRYQMHIPPGEDGAARQLDQTVNIGTLRLWLSGNILVPELKYMIQLAFAGRDYRDGATSPVYDAFLDYGAHRDLNVKAGQYFVPFDRLRTVREFALQMADRPRPVAEFTLDRDVGVTLYSEKFLGDKSPLAWRIGAFGGGGTNLSLGKEPGGLFVGRLELRPLGPIDDDSEGDLERRAKPGLAIGGAFAANLNTNRLRSTTGPTFTGGTTDYLHAAADLVFKWHGWALQGEYLWKQASEDSIVSTDADGEPLTEYTRSGQGWVVQTSYVFDPPIELVARLTRMYAFKGTDPKLVTEVEEFGQEIGAGVNYYINEHRMKLQADWIARMPYNFDFSGADHMLHAQLDVTF